MNGWKEGSAGKTGQDSQPPLEILPPRNLTLFSIRQLTDAALIPNRHPYQPTPLNEGREGFQDICQASSAMIMIELGLVESFHSQERHPEAYNLSLFWQLRCRIHPPIQQNPLEKQHPTCSPPSPIKASGTSPS